MLVLAVSTALASGHMIIDPVIRVCSVQLYSNPPHPPLSQPFVYFPYKPVEQSRHCGLVLDERLH